MFSCDKVITIPQYKGTCWFNAILMAIFYSQHSRKLLYHHFEGKKDKFSRIMNDIIKHNYIKTDQAIKYFEFMKPENILKYINADTTELYKLWKTHKIYSNETQSFLPFFLKSLNKNVLDIMIYEDNCYANFYSILPNFFTRFYKEDGKTENIDLAKWSGIDSKDITDPDYIIVNNISKPSINHNRYNIMFLHVFHFIQSKLNLKTYGIDIKGLVDFNDEIYHNGNKYILDSVLLDNNNIDTKSGHVIAGITCNNNHYVYNGWIRTTRDPGIPKNYGNEKIPCELMKFDWNVKEDSNYCLNAKLCKLDKYDESRRGELCFTFNDYRYITLIYVKEDTSIKSNNTNLSISSSLTLPSLKSNSNDFSDLDSKDDIQKRFYLNVREYRKKEQDLYKSKLKIKKQMVLTFIKFESNYYLTIDDYLNKDELLLIKNPDIIFINNELNDELGVSYIKELEYLLNIHNYNNISLTEISSNNTLTYNDFNYELLEDNNNIRIYKLIENKTPKQFLEQPPTIKRIKKFTNTKNEFLNFKQSNIAEVTYLQDIINLLDITVKDDEKPPGFINRVSSLFTSLFTRAEAQALPTTIKKPDNNSYIDCVLIAFFNNNNPKIEELFFKKTLKNKHAIAIRDEFKSYYETKTYNKTKLLKAIQMYYNELTLKNPEYPKIVWARGKYYFIDLIIILQQIFNFNKNLIHILLSNNEKFKIITKKQITTIEITTLTTTTTTKPKTNIGKLRAIIARNKNNYYCFYDMKTYLKTEKYKIVGYIYY